MYIDNGRFGEFIGKLFEDERRKRKEAAEKEDEKMLFDIWLHKCYDKSFADFRRELETQTASGGSVGSDTELDDSDIQEIINRTLSKKD